MRQKFYLHIETCVLEYDKLDVAMRMKNNINNKGGKCRVRMRTPPKFKRVVVDVKVTYNKK